MSVWGCPKISASEVSSPTKTVKYRIKSLLSKDQVLHNIFSKRSFSVFSCFIISRFFQN